MDYFSVEFIFACGIIVGVALAIVAQSIWHDVFAGQHGTTKRRSRSKRRCSNLNHKKERGISL